jgi:hypothetical protein
MNDIVFDLEEVTSPSPKDLFRELTRLVSENPETKGFALRWKTSEGVERFLTFDALGEVAVLTVPEGVRMFHGLSVEGVRAIAEGADPADHSRVHTIWKKDP